MNVYSHLIYNSLKLERAQMLVKTKVITDNKKEQIMINATTQTNLSIMKADAKGFLMYDPIYMTFWKGKIIETEIKSVVAGC